MLYQRGVERRRKLKEDFDDKWKLKEIEIANTARDKKREWLKDKEVSKAVVDKRYDALRKQFFEPPTPDNAVREKNLESLANVVLINVRSIKRRKLYTLESKQLL